MPGHSDEIIKRLEDQAAINQATLVKLEEERHKSIEIGRKLDEAVKALDAAGKRTAKRSVYLDQLRGGGAAEEQIDVEESIERAVSNIEGNGHVMWKGERIPLIRSMPRGLQGVREGRGLVMFRMMRAMVVAGAQGKTGINDAVDVAAKIFGPEDSATRSLEEQRDIVKKAGGDEAFLKRALGTQILGSGGSFVAPQFTTTFLDFLFAVSVVRGLGAQSMPLVGAGGVAAVFLDGAINVAYREEAGTQNESSPVDGSLQVIRRILSATIALDDELLQEASFAIDAILRTHIGRAMAARSDRAFIVGRGTQNEIRGLDWWVEQPTTSHVANRSLATGAVTVQTILQDVANAIGRITSVENKPFYRDQGATPGVIMSDREARGLQIASEGAGGAISRPFREEISGGTFCGVPLGRTTQLPQTQVGDSAGSGTLNKARVYFADFGSLAIYERDGVGIESFRGGTFRDGSGQLKSGLSDRQTVLRVDTYHDFVDLYRGKSIARIDSVDWGPAFGVSV